MADRYPLIFDSSDNRFKELPSGDSLNLNNSPIVNVPSIECEGVITGRPRFSVYNDTIITSVSVTLTSSDMNKVLLLNTSTTRFIYLPSGSSVQLGDWIRIVDVGTETSSGNAFKNNIVIYPNSGDRIQGGPINDILIMDVDSQAITLMWCGSTHDWRIVN